MVYAAVCPQKIQNKHGMKKTQHIPTHLMIFTMFNLFNDQDLGCSPRIWDGLFPRISRGLKRHKRGYSRSGIGQTENDNRPQTCGWFTSGNWISNKSTNMRMKSTKHVHLKCWDGLTRISQSLISMALNFDPEMPRWETSPKPSSSLKAMIFRLVTACTSGSLPKWGIPCSCKHGRTDLLTQRG